MGEGHQDCNTRAKFEKFFGLNKIKVFMGGLSCYILYLDNVDYATPREYLD
jgi:hypothetical protein